MFVLSHLIVTLIMLWAEQFCVNPEMGSGTRLRQRTLSFCLFLPPPAFLRNSEQDM